ncbi:MAG: rod shape-determining protein MreC [Prevotella sp.]|nr:rod shape-determining protein MreC [Prevotella sp.]MCD8305740.1 rod shape-determining protein MreC [Prevotella sp.]
MQHLFDFLATKYHWLLFLLLEIAGLALLFRYNSYQGSVWLSSANAVSGECYEMTSAVVSYFNLREINSRLTERNNLLEKELNAAHAQLAALETDSAALTAEVPAGFYHINARVVQNSVHKKDNLLTINKGYADGVRRNMGVVSGTGVVGIVYLVSAHYSVVIPVLNSHSNISCAIRGSRYFGYLSWAGGDSRYAYMENVPRYARYRKGAIIETSGFSSVFPQGITVGKVLATFNSADGLSYRIKVELATNFGNLYDVCVIDNSKLQEQLDILRAAEDSLTSRKNI